MINNRQNGRRRGRGGPQVRGGNGPDRSNRIDNRARGNAAQLHEKYRNLARDAQTQGDRVMTEYYLQFADHYFRVLGETRQRYEEQNQHRRQRDDADYDDLDGDGIDEGYEGERVGRVEQQAYRSRDEERPEAFQPAAPYQPAPPPAVTASGENQTADDEAGNGEAGAGDDGQRRRGRRGRRPAAAAAATVDQVEAPAPRIEIDRLPPAFAGEPSSGDGDPTDAGDPPRRRRRAKSDDSSVAA